MNRTFLQLLAVTLIISSGTTLIAATGGTHHYGPNLAHGSPGPSVTYSVDMEASLKPAVLPVTIPGVLIIETDGSALTLDGGPLSFDGTNWTYKGDYHGSGTIMFRAKPVERER